MGWRENKRSKNERLTTGIKSTGEPLRQPQRVGRAPLVCVEMVVFHLLVTGVQWACIIEVTTPKCESNLWSISYEPWYNLYCTIRWPVAPAALVTPWNSRPVKGRDINQLGSVEDLWGQMSARLISSRQKQIILRLYWTYDIPSIQQCISRF